jgi:3-oxoacyl-[acyl-carrier protein] reductase
MTKKLEGKVAIVTGASKGIGASIALHLADEGASVVVNYSSSKEGAERVVNEIKHKGGKAAAVQANMSHPKEIQHLFSETKKLYGTLDILINNAGIYIPAPIEKVTPEDFHKMFDLNVLGLLLASQEAVKMFGTKGGSIINISSVVSTSMAADLSVYCGTKGAVDAITRSLAKELGHRKIRVNSINPGLIETEGTHAGGFLNDEKFLEETKQGTPLAGTYGQPHDIAKTAVFLASDDSAWITGESLYVTGGIY